MMYLWAILGVLVLSVAIPSSHAEDRWSQGVASAPADNPGNRMMVCYYSSYTDTRPSIGKFTPEDIDPKLCTHVIFAFVNLVNGETLQPSNWNDLGPDGLYKRTVALKERNPNLKILLAVGGWAVGSEPFVPMISSPSKRKAFVRNTIRYLREHNFDGLDIDWEFPGARGSPPEDKYRFTLLLQEMQDAFQREARETGRDKLLLTLATAGGSYFINKAYEPDQIGQYVDYMLLMAYNYHGSWNNFTGHHSGLYPRSDEVGPMRELNQEWTVEYWQKQGVPKSKMVVGIATYGMSFALKTPAQHGLGAPTVGGGTAGTYTRESGILSFYEICEKLKGPWNYVWIDEQKAPYAYYQNQWVGFDDVNSVRYKAEFIRHNGFAGAFIWSMEMEDFRGVCGEGKYPLLNTVNKILRPYKENDYRSRAALPTSLNPVHGDAVFTRLQPQNPLPIAKDDSRSTQFEPEYTSQNNVNGDVDDNLNQDVVYSRNPDRQRAFIRYREQEKVKNETHLAPRMIKAAPVPGHYIDTPANNRHQQTTPRARVTEEFQCTTPGIHTDHSSCDSYFVCIIAGHQWKLYRMKCPNGLGFDDRTKACLLSKRCN